MTQGSSAGLRWLKGLLMWSLLAQITALSHWCAWIVMVRLVTQALSVTSSKARAEP